jgi:putative transposase
MDLSKPLYHRRRFPAEIISHCVWLYFRFCLSYRDVEEMMAERGVVVTYETIRDWSQKFGGTYAKRLRSRTPRPGDRWHLDEVYLSINGRLQYLWRAFCPKIRTTGGGRMTAWARCHLCCHFC